MAIIDFSRPLVLATASPARRKLVAEAGLSFISQVVSVDASAKGGELLDAYVERLARAKAEAAVPPSLGAVIVAVDTAIGLEGEIIGKPEDEAHARATLQRLSGRTHEVASAIAIRDFRAASLDVKITVTKVELVEMSGAMVDWYVENGEWRGRAGAYAIQGKGACLVKRVDGCFTNVIGISMPTLFEMLGAVGD